MNKRQTKFFGYWLVLMAVVACAAPFGLSSGFAQEQKSTPPAAAAKADTPAKAEAAEKSTPAESKDAAKSTATATEKPAEKSTAPATPAATTPPPADQAPRSTAAAAA